jgi:hypothetical protein
MKTLFSAAGTTAAGGTLAVAATLHRLMAATTLGLAAVSAVQAGPLSSFSFAGDGNVLVFDALAGAGGWNGQITEFADPPLAAPRSLASLVTFSYDASANVLTGQFEFTDAVDLLSNAFGTLMGRFTDPAGNLVDGGQLELDYSVLGGTGLFSGSSGFGLSFLSFDPQSTAFNNYREDGLLVVGATAAVPLPGSAPLVGLGLALALAASRWAVRPRRPGETSGLASGPQLAQ